MWVLLVVVVIFVGVVLYVRSNAGTPEAEARQKVEADIDWLPPQIEAEVEREAAKLLAELNQQHPDPPREPDPPAEPLGLHDHDRDNLPQRHEGPSWMDSEDWEGRVVRYREQGRSEREIAETAAYLEQRGPRKPRSREEGIAHSVEIGIVTRAVYVPKEDEARFMTRDENGLPTLRLVDSGDRLSIWSPIDGGALINPKGPGLRSMGLCSSLARGHNYYLSAYRAADLSKGKWVDLKREPDNPHDKNAVAMCAPGSTVPFAYVQRGRAPAVAKRMDKGEDMAAVSLRGSRRGDHEETTVVLIGSRADLKAMLEA